MKLRDQNVLEKSGNLGDVGRKVKFGLDMSSIREIVGFLTNLYSNKGLAATREIFTNAVDSHVMVGNPDPVEVWLPSELRKMFVVRDRGRGMSAQEIEDNLSLYGWSDKRETDDATGALGLGFKSPLTYASQFSVLAVKDGWQVSALVSRGEDGVGEILITDPIPIDEPNGVTIEIPVSDVDEFNRDARNYFRFVDPGTVLINGEVPESLWDEGNSKVLRLDDDVLIVDGLDRNYIVMGNVPYPIPNLNTAIRNHAKIVARVPIGTVDFVPSREALHMTPRTKEVTDVDLPKFIADHVTRLAQLDVDSKESHWEALRLSLSWKDKVSFKKPLLYRGEKIPSSVKGSGSQWRYVPSGRQPRYKNMDTMTSIALDREIFSDNVLIVYGHPDRKVDRDTKNAIVDLHNVRTVYIVQRLRVADRVWIEGVRTMRWADLVPKIPKQRVSKAKPQKWLSRSPADYVFAEREIEDDATVVYVLKTDNPLVQYRWDKKTREDYREQLWDFMNVRLTSKVTLVMVGTPYLEKFLKEHPEAMTPREFFQKELDEIDSTLSDDQMAWANGFHWLLEANPDDILDKDVVKLIERMRAANDPHARRLYDLRQVLLHNTRDFGATPQSVRSVPPKTNTLQQQIQDINDKYDLVSHPYHNTGQKVEIMNALYWYRNRKSRKKA